MTRNELIDLLRGQESLYASLSDLKGVTLYGSALQEEEIASDVDLLLAVNEGPGKAHPESDLVELRQSVWAGLKDKVPVTLDVQTESPELTVAELRKRGVPTLSIYER